MTLGDCDDGDSELWRQVTRELCEPNPEVYGALWGSGEAAADGQVQQWSAGLVRVPATRPLTLR